MMGELINYLNVMGLENPNRCLGGLSNDKYNQSKKITRFSSQDENYPWTFVIFSPVPNETVPQYQDMFKKYIEFEKYRNTVELIQGSTSLKDFVERYDNKKPYIIIISKATLHSGKVSGNSIDDDEIETISIEATDDGLSNLRILLDSLKKKGGNVDGIFFDEHHVGGNSQKSHEILQKFKEPNMFPNIFYIFITATYNKSILGWKIPTNNIFCWNYEDIILCKEIIQPENQVKLRDRHGEYFDIALECLTKSGVFLEDIQNDYRKYPYIFIMD